VPKNMKKGAPPGSVVPQIDRTRCEGKAACVAVCPNSVFVVERMRDSDYASLPLLARLKSLAHGRRTAYAVRADACNACGACVRACPERAITLELKRSVPVA